MTPVTCGGKRRLRSGHAVREGARHRERLRDPARPRRLQRAHRRSHGPAVRPPVGDRRRRGAPGGSGRRARRPGRAARTAGGAAGPAVGLGRPEWFMDYRNADGSVAEMCGNGIRVFARYLAQHGLAPGPEFAVATRSGPRQVRFGASGEITVEMGSVAVLGPGGAVIAGQAYPGLRVSVGNPHLACLVDGPLAGLDLSEAPKLDPGEFPEGGNVELVRMTGPASVAMRVYERGSGETRSCGTGAVAAAAAAAAAQWEQRRHLGGARAGRRPHDHPGGGPCVAHRPGRHRRRRRTRPVLAGHGTPGRRGRPRSLTPPGAVRRPAMNVSLVFKEHHQIHIIKRGGARSGAGRRRCRRCGSRRAGG